MSLTCSCTINVAGGDYVCEREIGNAHFPKDCMHEVRIPDEGGESGVIVRWLSYRRVQPCASGGGQ